MNNSNSLLICCGFAIFHDNKWHGIEAKKFPDPKPIVDAIEFQIREACARVSSGQYETLIFSGGVTRPELFQSGIRISEANSMRSFAINENLEGSTNALTECFARDSFENIFFSILRFYREYNSWPEKIGVISMTIKSLRFEIILESLALPCFEFIGVGTAKPTIQNCSNEIKNLILMTQENESTPFGDVFLRSDYFQEKRSKRTIGTEKYFRELVKKEYGWSSLLDRLFSSPPGFLEQSTDWPWC